MHPKNISIKDYTYLLPDEKIALFPLQQRDASKLLIYKNHQIVEDVYENIEKYLPEKSLLIFNNTKVIHARIFFQKNTGGLIEIFCLEPHETIHEYSAVMSKTGCVKWKCFIGGVSKWKNGDLEKKILHNQQEIILKARLIETIRDAYIVEFSWTPAELSFSEILLSSGEIPLPPYIKRKSNDADKNRYQTIFAKHDGSVAAPTAGLHFTDTVLHSFKLKNIKTDFVTLHVGAGTFKPVKSDTMSDHEMHAEWIDVRIETICNLLSNIENPIIATGTTSLRTLESLYWLGLKTIIHPSVQINELSISQWDVYESPLAEMNITVWESLQSLIEWMQKNELKNLFTKTQILITPGYKFRMIQGLITNFHQPQSTLLLLVAAILGEDWKKVYDYALNNQFRFLSYGDGSLLFV